MRASTARSAHQLNDSDLTKEDTAELNRLMVELLAKCNELGERQAPAGEWTASASGLLEQFGASTQAVAYLPRPLDRRIAGRARDRSYDRDADHGGCPRWSQGGARTESRSGSLASMPAA
ncbi:hypothetical protein ACWCP6_33375 [Streptomyces sp. NPDC002004]